MGGASDIRHPRSSAFTLIELVVVIAIMAVLAGMAITPLAGAWGSTKLRESARGLLTTATYAQGYAAMHQTRVQLVLDEAEGRYALAYEPDPRGEPGRFEPLNAEVRAVTPLGEGVRFGLIQIQPRLGEFTAGSSESGGTTSGGQGVVFEPSGAAGAAVIELTDGQRSWTLRIAASTGRAELVQGRATEQLIDRVDLDE